MTNFKSKLEELDELANQTKEHWDFVNNFIDGVEEKLKRHPLIDEDIDYWFDDKILGRCMLFWNQERKRVYFFGDNGVKPLREHKINIRLHIFDNYIDSFLGAVLEHCKSPKLNSISIEHNDKIETSDKSDKKSDISDRKSDISDKNDDLVDNITETCKCGHCSGTVNKNDYTYPYCSMCDSAGC